MRRRVPEPPGRAAAISLDPADSAAGSDEDHVPGAVTRHNLDYWPLRSGTAVPAFPAGRPAIRKGSNGVAETQPEYYSGLRWDTGSADGRDRGVIPGRGGRAGRRGRRQPR